jgi:osmotically-inducible protein OsmY
MNKSLLLIGGLGLGAGLIYMLDPQRGERRRVRARAQMRTYRHQADGLLGQTRSLLARTRTPFSSTWRRDERQLARAWPAGVANGFLTLSCVGLGAGLMYMLDPRMGKRRRALVYDKACAYWRRTGNVLGKTARDVSNRTRGLAADVRTQLTGGDRPEDRVLVARVRAHIGHIVSQPSAIDVTAQQGLVTLSGSIPANEVAKLLSTVEAVSGVSEVVNQLEVHTEMEHGSGVQTRNTVGS